MRLPYSLSHASCIHICMYSQLPLNLRFTYSINSDFSFFEYQLLFSFFSITNRLMTGKYLYISKYRFFYCCCCLHLLQKFKNIYIFYFHTSCKLLLLLFFLFYFLSKIFLLENFFEIHFWSLIFLKTQKMKRQQPLCHKTVFNYFN